MGIADDIKVNHNRDIPPKVKKSPFRAKGNKPFDLDMQMSITDRDTAKEYADKMLGQYFPGTPKYADEDHMELRVAWCEVTEHRASDEYVEQGVPKHSYTARILLDRQHLSHDVVSLIVDGEKMPVFNALKGPLNAEFKLDLAKYNNRIPCFMAILEKRPAHEYTYFGEFPLGDHNCKVPMPTRPITEMVNCRSVINGIPDTAVPIKVNPNCRIREHYDEATGYRYEATILLERGGKDVVRLWADGIEWPQIPSMLKGPVNAEFILDLGPFGNRVPEFMAELRPGVIEEIAAAYGISERAVANTFNLQESGELSGDELRSAQYATLSSIVLDLCKRAGLDTSDIDTTSLDTIIVSGMSVGKVWKVPVW